jgi:hypothetical protein
LEAAYATSETIADWAYKVSRVSFGLRFDDFRRAGPAARRIDLLSDISAEGKGAQ